MARPGDAARPGRAGPVRVGVRAVQRARRAARQPRRGRAARPARHLPQLLLRAAPAAVRRGRLRLPRVRPDDRQRHQRQADPAAGRRRAARRPLRRAARPRAGPRPARRHAAPGPALALPGRPRGQGPQHPAGLVHPARRRRDPLRGGAGRRPAAADRAVRAGGQRGAARAEPATRGSPPCWSRRCRPRRSSTTARRRAADPPDQGQRAAGGRRRWTTTWTARAAPRSSTEGYEDWVRTTIALRAPARRDAAGGQVPRVRLVQPPVAAGAARPGRRGADAARGSTAGTGCSREQREYLDEFWDAADVRGRGRPGGAAGRPVRPVPRAPGRRPGRAAADRRQGPDRPRVRRARVLGHRDVRAAGAHLHPAGAPCATRCAGGTAPWTGPGAGPRRSTWRARRSRGAPSRGRSRSAYWPAGTAAFHIAADIADALRRYVQVTQEADAERSTDTTTMYRCHCSAPPSSLRRSSASGSSSSDAMRIASGGGSCR